MRRLALLSVALLAGCFAGPQQLRRSVDDWDHKNYVNSPWWSATLWVVPVIPVMYVGAFAGDFLVTNPLAFWGEDAWDGAGTGYEHLHVEWTDGRQGSLYAEQSGWTKVVRK